MVRIAREGMDPNLLTGQPAPEYSKAEADTSDTA